MQQLQEKERRARRGKLRVYFGASAGVGKTYAMLTAARKLQAEACDVVIGYVETHGRADTIAQLCGLELLPRRQLDYRGRIAEEFDIDGALARQPSLVLVDELAHSNVPGSRHPKRWQDVEELLDAGIDVFTTVNVQHLESLNDVVGGITGVRVAETLPDTVFDEADEVVLVDVPVDELLARLKAGKVYGATQAERAAQHFFRKGNLIALRELALRRMADRIGDDVQAYRIEKSISGVWKTGADLLACVGPDDGAEHVIRSTAQLASQLNAGWHAVYVETPKLQRLSAVRRENILRMLKLARDLGATTAVLTGSDSAWAIYHYARAHNLSRIVLGRMRFQWFPLPSHAARIARFAPDLDLIKIGQVHAEERAPAASVPAGEAFDGAYKEDKAYWPYVWSVLACFLTALVAAPMQAYFDLANIVMLFLLAEVLIAVRLGRGPAVLAAFVSVAVFDFFFVSPRMSFAVSDVQYLVTFAVMLVVGLIVGQLTSGLRFQARIASHREGRARALYEFARELSGALQTEPIFETTRRTIQNTFRAQAALLLPDMEGQLQHKDDRAEMQDLDSGIAQWAFDRAQPAGMGTNTLPSSAYFYLPLVAPMRTRGVLALKPDDRRWLMVPEQRQYLDTFATLAAIALERVHYIEVAQDALVKMESERLRNSLLAALSHDLRTPLTSLVGMSESLTMSKPPLAQQQQDMALALHDEALRMSQLVTNLLDMARIQSGEVKLDLQWHTVEEVVGSALRACRSFTGSHVVRTQLVPNLPLVRFDAVLIERVLCNLLENATKYTPPGSTITIGAECTTDTLQLTVFDDGPGLPSGQEEAIFDKFTRGERESATLGVGLGLAICRAIVEAHCGRIGATASPNGGAGIMLRLPLGTPPAMPESEPNEIERPHE